jgi:uracil-DNA glycosylase
MSGDRNPYFDKYRNDCQAAAKTLAEHCMTLVSEIRACRICADRFAATETGHAPRPVVWFEAGGKGGGELGVESGGETVSKTGPQSGLQPGPRILIAGQAPGARVHASGRPFSDPSGDRLRDWLGIDTATFYDTSKVAIVPMAFCFPGYDAKGSDRPPPKICARTWRDRVMAHIGEVPLTLLIGAYAQPWHLRRAPGVANTARVPGTAGITNSARAPDTALASEIARIPNTVRVTDMPRGKMRVTDTVRAWRDHAPGAFPLPHPSWRNTGWIRKNPWFTAQVLPALRARVNEVLR